MSTFMKLNRMGAAMAVLFAGTAWAGPRDFGSSPGKIAHFHLSGAVTETPVTDPFGLAGERSVSLKQLLERLAKARKDDSVKAVVLTMGGVSMGSGQLEELRSSLRKFQAVDKRVFVHVDGLNMGTLALLSTASDLSIVPTADVWLTGMMVESLYVKDLLNKLGIEADFLHMGAYKSAAELLTQTGPSKEAADNVNWLLDGLYGAVVDMIAESRGLSQTQVRKLIDEGPYTAEQALEKGLVDSVQYRDEFLTEIKKIYGKEVTFDNRYGEDEGPNVDFSNPFAFFSIFTDMMGKSEKTSTDSVAIVYVDGAIMPGHAQQSPFGGGGGAFSGDIAKALQKAADDRTVRAVVLRVDSPGGSALASEIIWRETQNVRARKPMIVSMGNVAGSGGYYVACGAHQIFADETTITASIGVVGGKLVTTGLWDKIGVNWVPYKRGGNADLMSSAQPFSDGQREDMLNWMDEIYGVFKEHVVKGREGKLSKPIDEIAGGRVFTGKQALELGLVDRIGGLAEAVEYAAREASISDYEIRVIPEPKNFIDTLLSELMGKGERPSDIEVRVRPRLFDNDQSILKSLLPMLERLDPMRVRALENALMRIELLHREHVITMMPMDLVIR